MNRVAIINKVAPAQLIARVSLEPSGCHILEVDMEGMHMPLFITQAQAAWLKRALSEFEIECRIDDGRISERTNRHVKAIMHDILVSE